MTVRPLLPFSSSYLITGGIFLGLCVLVLLLFALPLHSGFWGDDYYNLYRLARVADTGVWPFVLEGIAGPLGRPISLFSLALQHESWPHDAYAFKLVNLLTHLINGLLVLILVNTLLRLTGYDRRRSYLTALLCSALWVLHPIQFTTVLYVVQRMTQLSTLFSLLGILCYLYFRGLYVQGKPRPGLLGMSFSVLVFMGLAVLSKENGILLPLFILVIESTLLKDTCRDRRWKTWALVFLAGPLLLLCGWIILTIDGLMLGYAKRHFTPIERLLTQGLILLDYLQNIFLPSPGDFSRYHDDVPVARGLLQPLSTVFACMAVVGLIVFAILKRQRFGFLSFAVLWFFGGHVLESSFLDLRLYYEHRNYLPALGPLFFIAWVVSTLLARYDKMLIRLPLLLYVGALFLVSYLELRTWDDFDRQSIELAMQQPKSYAAWNKAIHTYARLGYRDAVIKAQAHLEGIDDNTLLPYIKYLYVQGCILQEAIPEERWALISRQSEKKDWYPFVTISFLNDLVSAMQEGHCPYVDPSGVIGITLTLTGKAEYRQFEHMLHELAALLCMYMEDTACALANVARALALQESVQKYTLKYNIATHAGNTALAAQVLARTKEYFAKNPKVALANGKVLARMESNLARIKAAERE